MYIIILALLVNGSVTTVTQEFTSYETCKAAITNAYDVSKRIVEKKVDSGLIQVPIMVCVKK